MLNHIAQALPVSTVARLIQSLISQNLSPLWVRGEVSNLKFQQSGNIYFNIKDDEAKLNVVIMSNSNARKYAQDIKNGVDILVFGRISYYKKEGYVTLFAEEIEFVGEGILKRKFDELKKKLEEEGLFRKEHKRKIPEFPQWVGVVTSPTGAAIQDILNITSRRFSSVNIVIFPAAVQGEGAAEEIERAIKVANKYASNFIDVLIVGRGGGSLEDLWCFNEERVARAIFNSKIPVISAVGHEIDYTIADFVADLRAPTPSAAAEMVVKDKNEILAYINNLKSRIESIFLKKLDDARYFLSVRGEEQLKKMLQEDISQIALTFENINIRFKNAFINFLENLKNRLKYSFGKLTALNPENTLKRGYSITYKINEKKQKEILKSATLANEGDLLLTKLSDGELQSKVQ